MIKIRLISFVLLVLMLPDSKGLSAQNTTREEYNFMTKGYRSILNEGLDMKKGYYTDYTWTDESWQYYKITFIELRRSKDKTLAGTIVQAFSKGSGNTYFYGIPALDCLGSDCNLSPFIDELKTSIWELDGAMTDAVLISMVKYISIRTSH
jgi:hypothetical protein